jgi:biotin carboxyl carrier protein
LLNIRELLEEIKNSPYEEIEIRAPHTGVVDFCKLEEGQRVVGASGTFREKPGTLLAHLTRERNKKPILAPEKGEVVFVARELAGKFVESGEPLLRLRHFLTKEEVIGRILKQTLSIFQAPERAKYYFVPEIDLKIKASGERSVTVRPGQEIMIASRMKRETPVVYDGPEGIIYTVYFGAGENVDVGGPLIGVCPEDLLGVIQDVVARVQTEWEERE